MHKIIRQILPTLVIFATLLPFAPRAFAQDVVPLSVEDLDPNDEVPKDLLAQALDYWNANSNEFENLNYISIVDFRPRSDQYRFFVLNMHDGTVASYHTAHGAGSVLTNPAYARKFSNENNSNKSSLGFARTAEVYDGSQKRSLKLDGLSPTDSNLRLRGIIVHGADQVHEANIVQGVGAGCIMLDWKIRDEVIDKIRGGSLMMMGYSKAR